MDSTMQEAISFSYTVYCKSFEVEKVCNFCILISNHKNVSQTIGMATQDYANSHGITNVSQQIIIEFHNCKFFLPQAIHNLQYKVYMLVVTVLGKVA